MRVMADGSEVMFVGPYATRAARELALFAIPPDSAADLAAHRALQLPVRRQVALDDHLEAASSPASPGGTFRIWRERRARLTTCPWPVDRVSGRAGRSRRRKRAVLEARRRLRDEAGQRAAADGPRRAGRQPVQVPGDRKRRVRRLFAGRNRDGLAGRAARRQGDAVDGGARRQRAPRDRHRVHRRDAATRSNWRRISSTAASSS